MITCGKMLCLARLTTSAPTSVVCRYSSTKSKICEFYSGKNVFITGSTGFMGKVLLEKILSTIPDVGRVYVLIRGKRNVSFNDRLKKLCNEPIFTKYKRVEAKNLSKIVGIEGHFGDLGLEISAKDRQTLAEHVNVVFHFASTVRFNGPLDVAMKSIFTGTKTMLTLADDMRNLSSFVYVSTAYSNSQLMMPDEKVYDMKTDGNSVLALYENNSKENVDRIVRKNYFDGRPNTYCFSKALTENYIRTHCRHLPIAITRPSVVAASILEPTPGYCDSPGALSFGMIYQGLGICRYIPIKEPACIDVIPVDIAINSLLVVGREIGLRISPETSVYNVSSGLHWGLTHKQVADCKLKAILRSPSTKAHRPVSLRTTEISRIEQNLVNYFSEMSSAVLIDVIAKIRGTETGTLKLTRWIQSIRDEQSPFYQNSWIFPRKNLDSAFERLSEDDKKLFPTHPSVKDNDEYFYNYWMSLRELLLNEKTDNGHTTHRNQKRLAVAQSLALPFATAASCIVAGSLYFL